MTHTEVAYTDVEPVGERMHFLRDALDCERLGVTVLDCEADWTGKEHDHADDDQEEVYLLIEGEATGVVEGEEVGMENGDALQVAPRRADGSETAGPRGRSSSAARSDRLAGVTDRRCGRSVSSHRDRLPSGRGRFPGGSEGPVSVHFCPFATEEQPSGARSQRS